MPTVLNKQNLVHWVNLFKKSRILVIGDFILDQFVWGSVERISPEAPVPVVNVKRESYMPGGSLNVAHNIHRLGGTVYPCGVVGRDREGRMLVKVIRHSGIEAGGIVYDPTRPTSIKTRIIAHSQQVVRVDREKAGDVSSRDIQQILSFIRKKIKNVDVLIVEDYGKGVIQQALLKEIGKLARKYKKPVLVDPKEKHFPYYNGVTVITPNRKEAYGGLAEIRSEKYSVDEVGKKLLKKLKCQAVLITLGEDGMALFEKSGAVTKIPTAAQEVYDVSGAGDTVISVLGMALAVGAPMREAAILSNLAAGVVVGKLGTATVSSEELILAIHQSNLSGAKKK